MSASIDLQVENTLLEAVEEAKGSILVVDDEPAICVVMGIILKLHGYAVYRAHNVSQAYDFLEETRPDLIVADIMMPGIDGLTMIRQIKSKPELADIPTVVLSALAAEQDRVDAINAGANAFLAKPFTASELKDVVEPLLTVTH
jgi:two-component system phosphate regulon response regulator PhoB